MAINVVSGIGWEGWVPVNPRVNTILTPDSLATVTAPGWISELDPAVFPQKIYPTDLWDIEYDYDADTGTQTYARFVTSIDIDGVVTLSEPINAGNVLFPVVSGHVAFFQGTGGMIADLGISPTNPALSLMASVNPGTYAIGNFLVANDAAGTIRAGNGTVPTQAASSGAAAPSIDTALFSAALTIAQISGGDSHGLETSMTMNGGSAGIATGLQSTLTTSQGLSGTLEASAIKGAFSITNSLVNGAYVTGVISNLTSIVSSSSLDTSNISMFLGKATAGGPTHIGSILQHIGPSQAAFNFNDNGDASFITSAGAGTSIGPFSQWRVISNGVAGYVLISAIPYT